MTTSLRHRKSKVFLRKFDSEIRLFHLEPCKIPKHKWSAYFTSIFKRSKSKHDNNDNMTTKSIHNSNTERSLSLKASIEEVEQVILDTKSEFDHYENIASSNENIIYHHYAASLPSSPVSLSPPPKHTMIINRQNKSKSLMPIDITSFSKGDHSITKNFSSTPTLTINDTNEIPSSLPSSSSPATAATTVAVVQRQCLPTRSPILRLSLDFENHHHHHSRQSSVQSSEDNNENDYDHTIVTSSSSLLERRRQRNSLLWKSSGLLELDNQPRQYYIYEEIEKNHHDHNNKEIEDLITDFRKMDQEQLQQNDEEHEIKSSSFNHNSNKNNQIGKDKAHYDAIVASTLSHRTRDDYSQQQRFLKNPLSSSLSSSSILNSNISACSSTVAPTIALNDNSGTSPPIIPIYTNDTDHQQTIDDNKKDNNTLIELLDTPPPSAQLIKPNLSLSPLPLSTNSMLSNEN
ncbi:unnamed protein product [Cunninghamella blakesleeana]